MLLLAPVVLGLLVGGFYFLNTTTPQVPPKLHNQEDWTLGSAKAPVTLIEYSSLTCPHCAAFHQSSFEKLKKDYIDTGKIFFIFRPFPFDSVATAASMINHCVAKTGAGNSSYFSFLEVLFKTQSQWSLAENPVAALAAYAEQAGINREALQNCLKDQSLLDSIRQTQQHASTVFSVNVTPTFILQDKKIEGNMPYEDIKEIIDGYLEAE